MSATDIDGRNSEPAEATSRYGLYDPSADRDSCGVGFITRKDGVQSHDVLVRAHEALCSVPHRGGISPEGVGDGGGVSVDLSEEWFRHLTGDPTLTRGSFGVGNFFVPVDPAARLAAEGLIAATFAERGIPVLLTRDVPVDNSATLPAAAQYQLPLRQWVFGLPDTIEPETATSGRSTAFDRLIHTALLAIEAAAYTDPAYTGLYPVSLSARTQVLKGRLSSNEVISYFPDLLDSKHSIHTVFFHTRFSTNTDPHPTMAQPFRFLAHNGELNTDKKNRIAENAIARAKDRVIVRPQGQSDSCRLDQTLQSRILEDDVDLVTSVVAMMPPAWENDHSLSPQVRAMLEYFSLGEEKNDGPAALVFGDGTVIGARLDRLGLRPLRTVETAEYLCAMSEAGQIDFPPETVIRRGRIKAGGMLYFDHSTGRSYNSTETLEDLASRRDYAALLDTARVPFGALPLPSSPEPGSPLRYEGDLALDQRYVAYANNQESFKFLMDPMLATGQEKISAMGYGNAINALSHQEGGLAKFFSQRFAQVTNPPLDSIREADSMTLRVALGAKPGSGATPAPQIVVDGPILDHRQMLALREQQDTPLRRFGMFYRPDTANPVVNAAALEAAIESLCDAVEEFARTSGGLVVLTDRNVNKAEAALPLILAVSAVNQRLVDSGLRLRASIIAESGQISSAHHVSTALGFGASAVYPISVRLRAEEKFAQDPDAAFGRFVKAAQKSLMKTMGRVGLCTVESYIAGEFFEPNYLNTDDPVLARYFPEVRATVGGVGFAEVAAAVADWHATAITVASEADIPLLGLFKERSEGAGHSFGTVAVRGFVDMTEETLALPGATETTAEQANKQDTESATVQLADPDEALRLLTLGTLDDAFGLSDKAYRPSGFGALSKAEIDAFPGTRGYADFVRSLVDERTQRPSSLRDVLAFPADVTALQTSAQFQAELARFSVTGNTGILVRGLTIAHEDAGLVRLTLTGPHADDLARLGALADALVARFGTERGIGIEGHWIEATSLVLRPGSAAAEFLALLATAPESVDHTEVQPASEITRTLASGAMSHGALVAPAHEAVAHGTNMVGGMSNSGEGGEAMVRYGTIRGSRIKQFASGRFGVWAGYLADPMLQELEIKIGQGAKPGEGGQLPAPKVTVEIAAARGATPGVELVSPPPHHDTYSIEDLAQLIHDCKAARVRVVVKLVSSEGIGTIAVGVAKAGADVINVAGNTGGTGAAAVTSLKYAGRSAEIGIAEVHQALCATGLRQKVILRCSGAHQTAADVVKSALLGGDSFEFGTTALMMLGCVMAKNCNVKCPAGLTTNAEAFDGDPRDLAQYLLNIAHDVRRVLARLGLRSLREARGRSELLHLINHPAIVGDLDVRRMLTVVPEMPIDEPVYMEPGFRLDDAALPQVREALFERGETSVSPVYNPGAADTALGNLDKTVGGQLAIDIERLLNHEWPADSWPSDLDPHATPAAARGQLPPSVLVDDRGRRYLAPDSIRIETTKSAGQSYGAFCNDGMSMRHVGTCNDGVGKGASGGVIAVCSPGGGSPEDGGNVLIGNFALFGATGGRTFIEGQAGDRFAVRNSGASAVVEGVGDFACEYMTGGAVLNLGGFGKGFGNGMSGGFLYQYDPAGTFAAQVSADSIDLHPLVPEDASTDPMAAHHHDVVHRLLLAHFDATGSSRAAILLADWETVRHDFVYGMPRALLQYQDADEILAAKSRKELAEELSAALAGHQLRSFKLRYKDGTPVHAGVVPAYGTADTTEMYALLGSYTVLNLAQQLALTRVSGATDASDPRVQKAVRNLVLTEDFLLMHKLQRYAREALIDYSDAELAVLVSHKRLTDFKESLRRRNVLTSDSPGTLAWILHQDAKNRAALGHLPSFDELFAHRAVPDLALQAVVAR